MALSSILDPRSSILNLHSWLLGGFRSLPLPNRAIRILDTFDRNRLLLLIQQRWVVEALSADGFERDDLLRLILVIDDFDHFTAFRARRQFMFERLFAAGFDLDLGRYVVARKKLTVFVARKSEIPLDNFDRFGSGVLDDDLYQLRIVNDSSVRTLSASRTSVIRRNWRGSIFVTPMSLTSLSFVFCLRKFADFSRHWWRR